MKILVSILLLICVTATIVPCCEFDSCSDETTAAASDGQEQQEGTCSPFFTCASCPTGIITTQFVEISTPTHLTISRYPAHHSSSLSHYHASFWQPPRLG